MASALQQSKEHRNVANAEPSTRRSRRQERSREQKRSTTAAAGGPQTSAGVSGNHVAFEPLSILGAASKTSASVQNGLKKDLNGSGHNGLDIKGKGRAVDDEVQNHGTFADGDDFIAFAASDESDTEGRSRKKREETVKDRGRTPDDEERPRKRRHDERDDRQSARADRLFDRERDERDRWRDEEDRDDRRRKRRRNDDVDYLDDRKDSRRYRDERGTEARYGSKYSSKKCPWIWDVDFDKCQNVAELMHCEVESFVDWISPTPKEDEIRGLIVEHISRIVRQSFPDAQVHPFGSYQTKLYLPEGDIDLVIISDSMAYSDKVTVLHVLANSLKRGGITSHVTIIAKARVPIVKFTSRHGRFKVDISINQQNGLVSGNIISGFLRDMIPSGATDSESKALKSLVMITKAFLSQRGMNEVYTGGLGSYSVVCLAVSFLQMHPKIRRGEIDPEKNLGVLVMEFFELYGLRFNYDEVGISLREGGTYFGKKQRGWHADYKRNMLSVEDPADPSNDISSGSYHFHKVKTAFAGAHSILTSTAYLRAGILSSRRYGRAVRLRDDYNPEDLSLLSTVMGITQETLNHRRLVLELYEDRTLHKILGVQPRALVTIAADVVDGHSRSVDPDARRQNSSFHPSAPKGISTTGLEASHHDATHNDEGSDGELTVTPLNGHPQEAEEEGGRYAIGRQPPKKRRKTGKEADAHTVIFVNDDDDDREEGQYVSIDDSEDSDAGANSFSRPASNGRDQADKKRSYWLSKAKGVGGVEQDSR